MKSQPSANPGKAQADIVAEFNPACGHNQGKRAAVSDEKEREMVYLGSSNFR